MVMKNKAPSYLNIEIHIKSDNMDSVEIIVYAIVMAITLGLCLQVFYWLYSRIHIGYAWWFMGKRYEVTFKPENSPYRMKKTNTSKKAWLGMCSTIDDPAIIEVADQLKALSIGMNPLRKANFILKFVQENITYELERSSKDNWQMPSCTLERKKGDCEDSAFLFACLAYHCGLDVVQIEMTRHMTAGVHVSPMIGKKYIFDGKKYYRAETTTGFLNYIGLTISSYNEVYWMAKPIVPDDEFKAKLIDV